MIKNSKSLMDKAKNIANKSNITVNEVLQNYMFERILERLSISKYKNNFILKGGLLLSSIMGIDSRTTMDMDACIKGINLTDEELYRVLTEILSIDIQDNVTFNIKNFRPIREEDTYGGLKYNLIATFDGLKVNLNVDIATGDVITPREIEYNYKMLFEDRTLQLIAYPIETIIAEKYQTVIERGILNSRMKDYYDLYYLLSKKLYNNDTLKEAIKKTFSKRNTDINIINQRMQEIEESDFLKDLWNNYANKHLYSKNLKYEDLIHTIKKIKTLKLI